MWHSIRDDTCILCIRLETRAYHSHGWKSASIVSRAMCQDFLDISNPKAVLEMTLRGFSCLTCGDCICLHYNNKKYYIDIIEAKPQVKRFL